MTMQLRSSTDAEVARLRALNRRTGLMLGLIALSFFVAIIISNYYGGPRLAIGVVGSTVLLFLAIGIGRHLRK